MKNQVGSSRVDTVLKMMLIAFISLLAFSSGVWFGKSLSDSDHKLKALESDFSNASKTAQMDSKKEEGQEDPLAEEEVASLSEKFVTDQRDELSPEGEGKSEGKESEGRKIASEGSADKSLKEGKHAAAAHGEAHGAKAEKIAANAHAAKEKPDMTAAHAAAERVAHNETPTEAESKPAHAEAKAKVVAKSEAHGERAPSSMALPKTVGTAGEVEFTVQVASYPSADAAKERAAELVKKGFPAFPVEAKVNGNTWYRVSVGSFKTMREAATYRAQLLKQAELTSAIVQRIQR